MTSRTSLWSLRWLAIGACLSVSACNVAAELGTVHPGGGPDLDAGPGPDASPPPDPVDAGIPDALGPFDVVFTSVGAGSYPLMYETDAPENHFRLELKPDGNNYTALLSPLFSEPIEMAVTVTPGLVTLDGTVEIWDINVCGFGNRTTWEQIRYAVDSAGIPTGFVEGSGTYWSLAPKVGGYDGPMKGVGKIAPDTRAPSFKFAPPLYDDVSLPWDPIQIIASEPIEGMTFLQALQVAVANPPPFVLVPESPPGNQLGVRRADFLFTDWNGLGSGVTFGVTSIADSANNLSMPWSSLFSLFALGPAADRFRFDAPMGAVIGSGDTWVDSAAEPFCDTDGCAFASPFVPWMSDTGIAMRLASTAIAVPAISAVTVRYRTFTELTPIPPSVEIRLDFVAPGVPPESVFLPPAPLHSFNGLYVSDWITSTVPLPASLAGASEIGFAIMSPGNKPPPCGFSPIPSLSLLLDDVAVVL